MPGTWTDTALTRLRAASGRSGGARRLVVELLGEQDCCLSAQEVYDRVRVIVHNELPVKQDVHWHGLEVPFAMDGVAPITQEPIVGDVYDGLVKSTTAFGAFVEILPGTEALLHISEMRHGRTEKT